MPENRARKHHQERMSEAVREELATMVQGELADPRIGNATVTEVHMGPGGRSAHVFVFVEGDDEKVAQSTLQGLMAAKGYIRHELAERLGLRHPPELTFEVDRSHQYGTRIDELLSRIGKNRRRENSPTGRP